MLPINTKIINILNNRVKIFLRKTFRFISTGTVSLNKYLTKMNNSLLTLSHIHKNEQYFYRYRGRFIVNLCKLCLMLCEMFLH